jgi:hypothetical protein
VCAASGSLVGCCSLLPRTIIGSTISLTKTPHATILCRILPHFSHEYFGYPVPAANKATAESTQSLHRRFFHAKNELGKIPGHCGRAQFGPPPWIQPDAELPDPHQLGATYTNMQSTNKNPVQHRKYRNLSINHAHCLDFFSQLRTLLSVSTHCCLELAQSSPISGTGVTAQVVANTDLCLQSLDLCTKGGALAAARGNGRLELHFTDQSGSNIKRRPPPSAKPVCCVDRVLDYIDPAVNTNTNTQISYNSVSSLGNGYRDETQVTLPP